jgi:hypothetical protein
MMTRENLLQLKYKTMELDEAIKYLDSYIDEDISAITKLSKSIIKDFDSILNKEPKITRDTSIDISWSVADVKEQCPKLTLKEAYEVLKQVESDHDANYGVCWDSIRYAASEMYPNKVKW